MNRVTVAEVKRYLGLDGGGEQEALLAAFLNAAEHTVEKVLRKPITDDTPEIVKTAVLYCVWQYYFHRDDGEFNAAGIESTVAVMLSDLRGDVF
jgi:hypothetical protein